MTTIPAGSAEVEIRGRLDALKADLLQAEAEYNKYEDKTKKSAAAAAKERVRIIAAAIKEQERLLNATLAAQERAQKAADQAAAKSRAAAYDAAYREAKAINDRMIADERAASKAKADAYNQAYAEAHRINNQMVADARERARYEAAYVAAHAENAKRDEAAAAKNVAAQEDLLRRANRLTSEYDAETGAQLRLNAAIKEANVLKEKGIIDAKTEATVIKNAQLQYERFLKSQASSKAGGLAQHQLTNLSFQANDIITGLLSGQGLGQVTAQQGGQIFQILQTSAGGFAGALKSLITPLNLTIAGVGALAVAGGALAFEMHKGAEEQANFTNATLATGNAAGITASQFYTVSQAVAKSTETSVTGVRDLELQIIRSGKVGSESFTLLTTSAIKLADAMGQKPADALTTLLGLTDDVAASSARLNEQLHFLTEAQWLEIKALQESGDKAGAFKLALEAVDKQMQENVKNAGSFERIIRSIGTAWDSFVAKLKDAGRVQTAAEQIAALQEALNRPQNAGSDKILTVDEAGNERLIRRADAYRRIADLQRTIQREQDAADRKEKAAAEERGRIERDMTYGKKDDGIAQVTADIAKTTEDLANARSDLATATTDAAKAEAQLRVAAAESALKGENKKLADLTKVPKDPNARREASLKREEDALRANIKATWELSDAYTKGSDVAFKAESDRKAAVDATRKGIDLATRQQLQLNLEISQAAQGASQQTAALADQTKALKDRNDQVESGAMSQQQADEELAINLQLLQYQAALANASGEEAAKLLAKIQALDKGLHDLNDEQRRKTFEDNLVQQERQNALLEEQIKLVGQSNREQSIALAIAQKKAELDARGEFDPERRKKEIDAAKAGADLGATLDSAQQQYGLSTKAEGIANVNSSIQDPKRTAEEMTEIWRASYAEIDRLEKEGVLNHAQAEKAKADADMKYQSMRLSSTKAFFDGLATLANSSNETLKGIGKAAAITNATISAYEAINQVLADPTLGTFSKIALSASIAAQAFANVQQIAGMATGGIVTGSGGPTQDNQVRRLSVGEGVITARGVQNNPGLVQAVNAGARVMPNISVPRRQPYMPSAPEPQQIVVRSYFDDNGNFQAKVESVSRGVAVKESRNQISNFSNNVMPQRQIQISQNSRVRGGRSKP